MLSWKLWRSLNNPPRHHPLFQYVLTKAKNEEPRVTPGFFMWAFMCSSLTFFWTLVVDWLPYLLLGILILFNTIYSMRWVLRISATIASEKEQNRYDLLASLPSGLLGISWAISTGCVHRRSSFRWMPYLILLGVLNVTCMLTLFTGLTAIIIKNASFSDRELINNLNLMQLGIIGIALMVIFYFDHIYSILSAILVGQLVSADNTNSTEARIRAFVGFFTLQCVLYSVSYGVLIFALPGIVHFVGLEGTELTMSLAFIAIVFYLFLREGSVNLLWYTLKRLSLADEKEIAIVLEPPYLLEKILHDADVRVPRLDNL